MSLHPRTTYAVPAETARVARACLPHGHPYLRLYDELGTLFYDHDFADLFSARGQPAVAPGRLAIVTLLPFAERLPDRQAADAVRSRIDWKYLLGLELTDPGFDPTILSEFRERLVGHQATSRLFDLVLERMQAQGVIRARGRQRSDSTHVLGAIRAMNRLELVGEAMRAALNALAIAAPEWLRGHAQPEWFARYGPRLAHARLPESPTKRQALADVIGGDGAALLHAVYGAEAPPSLRTLPAVDALRQIWVQNYLSNENGRVTWRDPHNIPPAARFISSPYDLEAHDARKYSLQWVGYKVHLTETCDDETPPLITHVLTTTAPVDDSKATASMHAALETKGRLPQYHIVDAGDVDAERLAASQRDDAIDLGGAVRGSVRWQAHTEGAFDLSRLVIDWDQRQVTCPAGHTSLSWTPATDNRDNDVIKIKFARGDCCDCPFRSQCTRTARRSLTIRPREQHEALMANRTRQSTPEYKTMQARRCGIEGTLSYGVRICGMRRTRYVGLARTHLQHCASAAVMNLARMVRWLSGEPRPHTHQAPFQKLQRTAA
jgi:transposase